MKVRYAPEAVADLEAAITYIRDRNPQAAADVANRVFDTIDALADRSIDGPEQVLTTGEVVRSWPVHPFRLFYQRDSETLHVLRIHHHSRRPLTG